MRIAPQRVAPFGHLGINACVPLPRAYRSLPRPSSPPCAQASPTCLHSLDYNNLCSSRACTICLVLQQNHLSPRRPTAGSCEPPVLQRPDSVAAQSATVSHLHVPHISSDQSFPAVTAFAAPARRNWVAQ